jgi:hypothetical protein
MSRSRPAVIALVATAVQVVLVAALGNPSVSESLGRRAAKSSPAGRDALLALITFAWPTDRGTLSAGAYAGVYVGIAVLLVLTYVLVYALARGVPTAGQVLLGTWLAVLGASVAAVIVRAAFVPSPDDEGLDRVLFGSVTGGTVLYALAAGLLAGVFATLIHVATRRPAEGQPQAWQAGPPVPAAATPYGYWPAAPAAAEAEQRTEWLPTAPEARAPEGSTQPLPAPPAGTGSEQPTTQLPSRAPVWAAETSQLPPLPDEDR